MGDIEPKIVTYSREIWRQLPKVDDPLDRRVVDSCIERFFHQKWSASEAVAWIRCLEHVQPNLNEDYALAKMERVARQVKNRHIKEGVQVPWDWR